jgi:hypothetical protein
MKNAQNIYSGAQEREEKSPFRQTVLCSRVFIFRENAWRLFLPVPDKSFVGFVGGKRGVARGFRERGNKRSRTLVLPKKK